MGGGRYLLADSTHRKPQGQKHGDQGPRCHLCRGVRLHLEDARVKGVGPFEDSRAGAAYPEELRRPPDPQRGGLSS